MPREVASAGSYLPLLSSAPLLHMYPPEPKNLHSVAIRPPYSKQDLSRCQICRCPVGELQTQTLPGSAVSIRPQTSRTVIFMLACTRCASCSKVGSCSPSCCTVGDALVSGPYMACSKASQFCEPQEISRAVGRSQRAVQDPLQFQGTSAASVYCQPTLTIMLAYREALCDGGIQPESLCHRSSPQHLKAINDFRD